MVRAASVTARSPGPPRTRSTTSPPASRPAISTKSNGSRLEIGFSLPSGERATLELFDASGRRIVAREVGGLGPGAHRVNLAENRRLAAGVYALRLTQGPNSRTLKATVSP